MLVDTGGGDVLGGWSPPPPKFWGCMWHHITQWGGYCMAMALIEFLPSISVMWAHKKDECECYSLKFRPHTPKCRVDVGCRLKLHAPAPIRVSCACWVEINFSPPTFFAHAENSCCCQLRSFWFRLKQAIQYVKKEKVNSHLISKFLVQVCKSWAMPNTK